MTDDELLVEVFCLGIIDENEKTVTIERLDRLLELLLLLDLPMYL